MFHALVGRGEHRAARHVQAFEMWLEQSKVAWGHAL
jgi:hypothetical protein